MLGKVKTRLAKSIGDIGAFEVYKGLVDITETETKKMTNCNIRVYFSDVVIESKWSDCEKYVQEGIGLGMRMENAFKEGFADGYEKVILIGSDLPDLKAELINESFNNLDHFDVVLGPAEDGGYYLIGMSSQKDFIFRNKSWSTEKLLEQTMTELDKKEISYHLLDQLNDIDTLEDLLNSDVSAKFKHLYELPRSNK